MGRFTNKDSDCGRLNIPEYIAQRDDDLSDYLHRQLIGYIGLVLPVLLVFTVLLRDGVKGWERLTSISAYYYTGAVALFVGMLVSLALFLFTYRGFKNPYGWADRGAGITAGVAALGVALFPVKAPSGVLALEWWTPAIGVVHYVSAVVLFAMFAVYALWLFRMPPVASEKNENEQNKTNENQTGRKQLSPGKKGRNVVYLVCGIFILGSIVVAFVMGRSENPESSIFIPESVALVAFSISWLVKGYTHKTIGHAAQTIGKASRSILRRQAARDNSQ